MPRTTTQVPAANPQADLQQLLQLMQQSNINGAQFQAELQREEERRQREEREATLSQLREQYGSITFTLARNSAVRYANRTSRTFIIGKLVKVSPNLLAADAQGSFHLSPEEADAINGITVDLTLNDDVLEELMDNREEVPGSVHEFEVLLSEPAQFSTPKYRPVDGEFQGRDVYYVSNPDAEGFNTEDPANWTTEITNFPKTALWLGGKVAAFITCRQSRANSTTLPVGNERSKFFEAMGEQARRRNERGLARWQADLPAQQRGSTTLDQLGADMAASTGAAAAKPAKSKSTAK